MGTGTINGGLPPSPQQSTHSGQFTQSQLGPCAILQQHTYGHNEHFGNQVMHPGMSAHGMMFRPDGATAFDGYDSFNGYHVSNDCPQMLTMQDPAFVRPVQMTTPPPAADEGIMARSERSTASLGSPLPMRKTVSDKPRVIRPPRTRRRPKQGKQEKGSSPVISAPLSQLTAHLTHIPVKDMEAWVNRPADVRHKEAQKAGRIGRPMNSFMLYRSAYADRTKEWCSQNNHQVVSRVSGQSWPLEPPEVREKFELFAVLERDNHQKAHPGYKFTPNKNQTPPKKKRFLEEREPSDLGDPDYDLHSMQGRKRARSGDCDSSYSRGSTPYDRDSLRPTGSNRSSWQMNNPGRPIAGILSPPEHMHYLQPSVHPSMMGPNVEDVRFRKMGLPGYQYSPSTMLSGLPGAVHHELLQPPSNVTTPGQSDDSQLDPQLLAFDNGIRGTEGGNGAYNCSQYTLWQADSGANGYFPLSTGVTSNPQQQYTVEAPYHPSVQALPDGHEIWDLSHGANIGEVGKDFDQWIDT
ncbi:transcriptional regulator family: HMG [Paecilomyces variotii]|nr:transcriptional regulator family: HMG [Paecilomyces variotii]